MSFLSSKPICGTLEQQITLRGAVQGLGIRPTVARIAMEMGLTGTVRNQMEGVVIRFQRHNDEHVLHVFVERLKHEVTADLEVCVAVPKIATATLEGFCIESSEESGALGTIVPVDRVVCQKCGEEVRRRDNRRYLYPFTSCTACGPRYSILKAMPYDRRRTSMSRFRMCEQCDQEYRDPHDRRFHSQTNCCWACGPKLWSIGWDSTRALGQNALQSTIDSLQAGRIVAVKGIGGYQLLCDATNRAAVSTLRIRKRRSEKPFAMMVPSLVEAETIASLSKEEREAISSAIGPIVVAPVAAGTKVSSRTPVFELISPGLNDVGLMVATSPLHLILLDQMGVPLIVTSGNIDGEPLAYQETDAEQSLRGVADCFLHHDREIVRPIDDSVVRKLGKRIVNVRVARGIAPMPLDVPVPTPSIAVGGQQKVAVALSNGVQSTLGPHVGDLNSVAMRKRYAEQLRSLCDLYHCHSEWISRDLHPDYYTSQLDFAIPRRSIQHHHAHVVSGMLQQGWLHRTVLGVALDGTGFGSDGTIWGGEILIATKHKFQRVGHLRPIALAGGEAAIRDPIRVAIALMHDAFPKSFYQCSRYLDVGPDFINTVTRLLRSRRLSPLASSAGRLFDGMASLILPRWTPTFEGEAAMRLEAICDPREKEMYQFALSSEVPRQVDWRPVILQWMDDRKAGIDTSRMASRFHRGLADVLVRIANQYPDLPVVLTGGVFQNRVLVDAIVDFMPDDRVVSWPGEIPPNDGGLAAGQLFAGADEGEWI